METNAKVSVIIPTYNRFDTLKQAVQSVKHQTYPNMEIIVINDASTDSRYYKPRLKKHHFKEETENWDLPKQPITASSRFFYSNPESLSYIGTTVKNGLMNFF